MMPKKRDISVRLSKVRENGVCDEASSLQGFDFAQPDKQNFHHTFYKTTHNFYNTTYTPQFGFYLQG